MDIEVMKSELSGVRTEGIFHPFKSELHLA